MKITVDHVIGLDDYPAKTLVVGIGKPGSKWSGRRLLDADTVELLWPVRQLANICRAAETRYGYIQTNEELVVCCFSERDQVMWNAAIMPIPWSRHGVEVLTSDLALWWLCMLAMSDPCHRAIVAEGDMVKINAWDIIYHDDERGWVQRHRYSNFEEPTVPPSPPGYQTPSPGNQAAFAAGAGLHAHDWFDLDDNLALPGERDPAFDGDEFFHVGNDVNVDDVDVGMADLIAFNNAHPGAGHPVASP